MANHAIGQLPGGKGQAKRDSVENDRSVNAAAKATAQAATSAARGRTASEPLSDKQWDMWQIDATPNGSYCVNQGKSGVMVGIIDSGIDGTHPDLRANFNRRLNRNFTTDIPSINGACEHPSCVDPVDEDDNGHSWHVSGSSRQSSTASVWPASPQGDARQHPRRPGLRGLLCSRPSTR